MNTDLVRPLFFISIGLTITGELLHKFVGWEFGSLLFMVGAVCSVACGAMLFLHNILGHKNIKLGAETLPPIKEIASVMVGGDPISEEKKKALLKALVKAKRASSCGSIHKKIPFQIVDLWGGTWELEAYEEKGGARGFSINRVFYSGTKSEVVADSVGL